MTSEWVRPRPGSRSYRRDALAALAIALGAGVTALLYSRMGLYPDPAEPWLTVVGLAAMTLPLALRRRFPEAVAIVAAAAFYVCQQFSVPEFLVSNIALFVAVYSLGAWGKSRRRATILRLSIIAAMFAWVTVNLIVTVSDPELLPEVSRSGVFSQFAVFAIINVLTNILYFGGAYFFGDSAWAAARDRAELQSRTIELETQRELGAEQAVALDRMLIARELHDVVAHHVSVMGVQAGAARRILTTDPEQALGSLATIEQSAREAVDELHRLLTTLRDTTPDAASRSSSTLGLAQLPALLTDMTDAGMHANLTVVGAERHVTSLAGFTLYRVAQEALTNVRKHAGDRAIAEVRLRYLDNAIELEVSNTGVGRAIARGATGGLGLIGMRERVLAVGGTVEAGARPHGGFLVRAAIPDRGTGFPDRTAALPDGGATHPDGKAGHPDRWTSL
ncbi:sensor histidine kinase [Salinibacterium sp.]|uniref:sensor histidine kinase n=1 Tax=Salinibacterium sp. TaxID=1915057 RepID=UPI00286B4F97|nr:sensor histidine kinase [Salinibacterium sp.]